jgi:hypothetical protein
VFEQCHCLKPVNFTQSQCPCGIDGLRGITIGVMMSVSCNAETQRGAFERGTRFFLNYAEAEFAWMRQRIAGQPLGYFGRRVPVGLMQFNGDLSGDSTDSIIASLVSLAPISDTGHFARPLTFRLHLPGQSFQ